MFGAAMLAGAAMALAQTPAPPATAVAPPPGYRQLVPGLLARSRFSTDATNGRRVELWDLLVGPNGRSAATTLPGGAVLEVRGGAGRIVIADKEQELRSGATLSLPEGTPFQLVNTRADLGLSIRATIIAGARR